MGRFFTALICLFILPLKGLWACDFERNLYGKSLKEVVSEFDQKDFYVPDNVDDFDLPLLGRDVCNRSALSTGVFNYYFIENQLVEINYKGEGSSKKIVSELESEFGKNSSAAMLDSSSDDHAHLFWSAKDSTVLFYTERQDGVLFSNIKAESKKYAPLKNALLIQEEEQQFKLGLAGGEE